MSATYTELHICPYETKLNKKKERWRLALDREKLYMILMAGHTKGKKRATPNFLVSPDTLSPLTKCEIISYNH